MADPALAFFVFRRPEQTEKVLKSVLENHIGRLYVYGDGPREGHVEEANKVDEVKKLVRTHAKGRIYHEDFSSKNLGCRGRLVSGLRHFFANEEEGLILEDDCLPGAAFFAFAKAMLERFRADSRVWHISGSCPLIPEKRPKKSYWYSRYPHIWGWATWRRAFDHYDPDMTLWKSLDCEQKEWLCRQMGLVDDGEKAWWFHHWEAVITGSLDTWDVQWSFACLNNKKVAITPGANLISNIGFGSDATHTHNAKHSSANRPLEEISRIDALLPVQRDLKTDRKTAIEEYGATAPDPGIRWRLAQFIKSCRAKCSPRLK